MFFIDFAGNRLLFAIIASLHVFINHALAIGAYPVVTLLEYRAWRKGDTGRDELAYKITFVLFIVTTTAGALTGVGIWFSASLIAPFAIGSLLRVFFWGWFIEWIVFISEVVLILIYFLTWKRMSQGAGKKAHIGIGVILSVFSWLTMAIIVGILGFMMGSGHWPQDKSFFSAFFNPIYLPQLAFRTTYAMGVAGLCVWFLLYFFTSKGSSLRAGAVRFVSKWMLLWVIPFVAACLWYWNVIPDAMAANIDVALLTQRFMHWHSNLATIMIVTIAALILVAAAGLVRPKLIQSALLLIPFVLGIWLLGHFERVREFIRKPYVIADYMYSSGVRQSELPVFQRDGILKYATYVSHHRITSENTVDAGKDVFVVACSRCHTTSGINGMVSKFSDLYGDGPWDKDAMTAFVYSMHTSRTFMPPFPGNDREAEALVAYLKSLQTQHEYIISAQNSWTVRPIDQSE
ncbi:MAG: c-type cytochrome [Candidatus Zixiibacteriota bacterium]|nr:MAG: c-type cytochrome [candidate division Zixibacteria bacterium]